MAASAEMTPPAWNMMTPPPRGSGAMDKVGPALVPAARHARELARSIDADMRSSVHPGKQAEEIALAASQGESTSGCHDATQMLRHRPG